MGVLEDDTMQIDLHSVPNGHTTGMLVPVLPAQGIKFQADFTVRHRSGLICWQRSASDWSSRTEKAG